MKHIAFALTALMLAHSAHALVCPPNSDRMVRTVSQPYADAVFWVPVAPGETPRATVLNAASEPIALEPTGQTIANWAALKWKTPPAPGQPYTLAEQSPTGQFSEVDARQIVAPPRDEPALRILSQPKLSSFQFKAGSFQAHSAVVFNVETSAPAGDYLVLMEVAHSQSLADSRTYIVAPDSIAGAVSVGLGTQPCQSNALSFWFEPGQTVWIKFSLLSRRGAVTPFAGGPVKYTLPTEAQIR